MNTEIKNLRKKYGLTQAEVAEVIDITPQNYNIMETKGTYLTEARYNKLIKFYKDYDRVYEDKKNLINYYKKFIDN
jgi:DNA-binding XRE family transcriptional regulator